MAHLIQAALLVCLAILVFWIFGADGALARLRPPHHH